MNSTPFKTLFPMLFSPNSINHCHLQVPPWMMQNPELLWEFMPKGVMFGFETHVLFDQEIIFFTLMIVPVFVYGLAFTTLIENCAFHDTDQASLCKSFRRVRWALGFVFGTFLFGLVDSRSWIHCRAQARGISWRRAYLLREQNSL